MKKSTGLLEVIKIFIQKKNYNKMQDFLNTANLTF